MEVVIVLCRVQTAANVGAVCRVMANCNLASLRIVQDANIYNETEVLTLALHARNIWDQAKFFSPTIEGLKDATSDCNAVFATTRRVGAKRKHSGFSPEEFVNFAISENYERIALVFGNERTGLTDEEVAICSHSINIPASPAYPSYNISHAVLILAYTLFTHKEETDSFFCVNRPQSREVCSTKVAELQPMSPLIKWKDKSEARRGMITFAKSCETASEIVFKLKQIGLYKKGGEKDCETFIAQMLTRSRLSEEEAEYFSNIFNKIFYEIKK